MVPITFDEFTAKATDISVPDAEIAAYLTGRPDDGVPFGPSVVPDPAKVIAAGPLAELQAEAAVASGLVGAYARLRRRTRFEARLGVGDKRPIVYAEGDSWLQFPFLINDIVDHLDSTHLVWCSSKAGDTLQNMVYQKPEYLKELTELLVTRQLPVKAFLFSGAGNDVVGIGPDGTAALSRIVRRYDPAKSIEWHIATDGVTETMAFIEKAYRKVLDDVEQAFPPSRFPHLKVVIHGYDYSPTRGVPTPDPHRPSYARDWTGEPLRRLDFPNNQEASKVVAALIDRLHATTARACAGRPQAVHADLRGTVPASEWADELHPTGVGFAHATDKLRTRYL